ncbi:MAG: Rrf2 family transcriptional regulator [Phycisphaerae bacterium]|nr:Rrf2 family transcriptional regulator [Phycisphaerae bacterium]
MLSQTVDYALRAMLHLAGQGGVAASTDRIAGRTSVPAGYLAKIMRDLVVAGLVSSFRGPRGGFALAREASAITLLDVVNAVEPIARIDRCPRREPCLGGLCALHRRIDEIAAHMEAAFAATSLADLLASDAERSARDTRDAG